MGHVDTGTMLLPFGGTSPRSRSASLSGARVAIRNAESQASRILLRYLAHGPLSDLQLHGYLGLPESRISARRSALMARGLVRWCEDVIGPYGATNGNYELTPAGVAVATSIKGSE